MGEKKAHHYLCLSFFDVEYLLEMEITLYFYSFTHVLSTYVSYDMVSYDSFLLQNHQTRTQV